MFDLNLSKKTNRKEIAEIINAARAIDRVSVREIIEHCFTDFFELHGDRQLLDDKAIVGGIAKFDDQAVSVIGEGGSGGALALAVANKVYMLENAVYSVLSPEGFATILWKDGKRRDEAAELMKMTADHLYEMKVIDGIIAEENLFEQLSITLKKALVELNALTPQELQNQRYERFRKF